MRKNLLVKPYLKWAGGKRQLLFEIKRHLPARINEYTYYEPFIGAGAVFFDIQPRKAVINDLNAQLMMTYRAVRNHIEELIQVLKSHKENNSEEYYYKVRALDREPIAFAGLTVAEKAARLIYLNKTCYNGLYRVNSQGLFNVPYGRYKNSIIFEEAALRAVHEYLAINEITICAADFAFALQSTDRQSFVYFDPPYHSADNTNFTSYQAGGFGAEEQLRLRDTFTWLTERGVKCLLSNADTDFIWEIYSDRRFAIITVPAKRAINSDPAGRGIINELLIKNF